MSGRATLPFLGLALAVATALRIEYLRELTFTPFGRALLLDAEWFDQAARQILSGEGLSKSDAYFRPPLYPLFLSALYRFFGESLLAPRIVQFLLGLGHVFLCWRLALLSHGARAASVAAFLAAAYGMFIYFEGEILATTLGMTLSTAGVVLLLESDARSSPWRAFGGGVALGLAALAHGTALVLGVAAIGWALLPLHRRAGGKVRALLASSVFLGLVLPVGVVTARNLAVSGDPVLIAWQGGINFFIGNNESADGKSALAPGFAEANQVIRTDDVYRDTMEVASRVLAERELARTLKGSEISRYWFGRGLEWITDQPKEAAILYLRKLVFFVSGFEISNNRDLRDQAFRFTPILRFFLAHIVVIMPFAFFGIVRGGIRNRAQLLLLLLFLVYGAAIAAFFVCARFRQPAIPWLLPFAASGLTLLYNDFRTRGFKRSLASVGILAALFVATNPRFLTATKIADVTSETDAPFHRYNLAVLFESEGDFDRAIAEYQTVAATGVNDPRVHLNLGNALARVGRGREAREAYRKVLALSPDFETAVRSNLGILATQEADWADAIRQFSACLELDPLHRQALVGLAAASLAAGRFDEAIVAHRRALEAEVGPEGPLRRGLAVAYLESGLLEDAEREGKSALKLLPDDVATVVTLAKIYASFGRAAEAEQMIERARELSGGAPAVEAAIEDARNRLLPPSP